MPKRAPEKGAIEWHSLPNAPEGWEDVQIGIIYLGYFESRESMLEMQRLHQEERARELPDGQTSVDFIQGFQQFQRRFLKQVVGGMRGVEGLDPGDAEGALDQVEYLGDEVQVGITSLGQEVQRLSSREKFHSEGDSE